MPKWRPRQQQIDRDAPERLTLNVEDKTYTWSPREIALMLRMGRVAKDPSNDRIAVALDQYLVDKRIIAIANETGRGSVHPRVAWNNGDLKIIKPGTPGLRIDEPKARDMIMAAIGSSQRTLELPVREVAPEVTEANLHSIGIDELVSVGTSDFSGSAAYRIHNVGRGMELFNGILLAPGEEFSFNENVGEIDAKNGFVEGYAIVQNRTQLEFGGGICQDSTTMFRAAFWAGLPITERWGHSFYISWYDKYGLGQNGNGMGMDATIFTGGPDLKFVNDTGNWLLIQSWSNPRTGVAQVELYGTKPDRRVELTQRVYDRVPAPPNPVYVVDAKQPARHPQANRYGARRDDDRRPPHRHRERRPSRARAVPHTVQGLAEHLHGQPGRYGSRRAAAAPARGSTARAARPPTTEQPAPEQPVPPAPEQPAPVAEQPAPSPDQIAPVPNG